MKRAYFSDALASLVVFLVALPLCMGVAIASGVPPAMGLVSGVIGGLVVGALAGSPLQVSGPAAGLAVIVYDIVQTYGVEVLAPMLVVAGGLQIIAGRLKIGQTFRAVAPAVVHAMLAGIGVLIFGSQVHVMVDDKPLSGGLDNLIMIPSAVVKGVVPLDGSPHHIAAAVGISTLVVLIVWSKARTRLPPALKVLPAPLLAVGLATIAAYVLALPVRYVQVPTDFASFIRLPTLSAFLRLGEPAILGTAFALACIASAESLLSAVAIDKKVKDGPRMDLDRELLAQGVGNMLAGIVGALPITGVIVRSTANVEAGAKTRASAMMHGLWLLGSVAVLPFALSRIPVAALAAVLVHIGWKLVDISAARQLWARGRGEFVVYLATVVAIVSTNLLDGLLFGLALAVLKLAYTFSNLQVDTTQGPAGRVDVDLHGSATFVRLPRLAQALESIPPDVEVHLHLEHLDYIDHACFELIGEWERRRETRGGTLVLEWEELDRRSRQRLTGKARVRRPVVNSEPAPAIQ